MRITIASLLIALALTFAYPTRAPGSDPVAAITAPARGQRVDGVVQILGSATHPAFDHYEVHFALDPNPTDTWFPIVLAGATPTDDAPLAQWDTDSISSGKYMLRLQVFGADGSLPAEVIVPDVVMRAGPDPDTPTPTPAAAATIAPAPVAAPALPIAPQRDAGNPPLRSLFAQLREKHDYRSTFLNSAAYSVAAFLALGVYLQLRKLVRPHVRRLLRRVRSDLRRP
jgi:hypothetical protein